VRVLICPDEYAGTLDAQAAGHAIADGLVGARPDLTVDIVPMADGGTGTLVALAAARVHRTRSLEVRGPLGDVVEAGYLVLDDGAVIEMATAAGRHLVSPSGCDPLRGCTFGVGQLIVHALDRGERRIIIALGGSATNDGGLGCLAALGATIRTADGRRVGAGAGGRALRSAATIDAGSLHPRLRGAELVVAADVTNPLLGPNGATRTFAPQKGATTADVDELERAMAHWAMLLGQLSGCDVAARPGAGAAGGLAAALVALGARIVPGGAWVADQVGLDGHLVVCDVVVTGEGRVDGTSARGKVVATVIERAHRHDRPVWILAGSLGAGHETLTGAQLIDVSAGIERDAPELRRAARPLLTGAAHALAASL